MATLLNTGDVPNIFAADELGTIMELVRKAAAKEKLKIESPEDFLIMMNFTNSYIK